jgi:hypothetical protein
MTSTGTRVWNILAIQAFLLLWLLFASCVSGNDAPGFLPSKSTKQRAQEEQNPQNPQ